MTETEVIAYRPDLDEVTTCDWLPLFAHSIIQEPNIFNGRYPDDQDVRPTQHWQRTGQVEPGAHGPGCGVGCIYCNQMGLDSNEAGERMAGYISLGVDGGISLNTRLMVGARHDRFIPPEQLIAELKHYAFYEPNSFVILENFNDPGLNWLQTAKLAELLVTELHHTGPISFITKLGMTRSC